MFEQAPYGLGAFYEDEVDTTESIFNLSTLSIIDAIGMDVIFDIDVDLLQYELNYDNFCFAGV